MSDRRSSERKTLSVALTGRGAHVPTADLFDGMSWESAGERSGEASHSVFQLLNHLVYWQDFALRWLAGEKPATPEHDADSWPGSAVPADRDVWEDAVDRFTKGLSELLRRAEESDLDRELGPKTTREILQIVASHNSYHAGQVAAQRRSLGAWPPPSGGFTW